ncbi:hypothetical protein, partial [Sphaerisporangium aureirubrum]
LIDLAGALARNGQFDRAEAIAQTIEHPDYLAEIVTKIIDYTTEERSRRLLAWALTRARWHTLLRAIAGVDFPVIIRLADDIFLVRTTKDAAVFGE